MPFIKFVYQQIDEYIGDLNYNQIDLDTYGFMLLSKLNHPTNEELEAIYSGKFEMRVAKICNIVWFTFQFAESGWGEAQFSLHLSPLIDKSSYFDYCKTLNIVVIDTENGRVASIQKIDLPSYAQDMLKTYIDSTYSMPFNENIYHNQICSIQSKYSVQQIAQASQQLIYIE